MKKHTVFVFGNTLLPDDSVPALLIPDFTRAVPYTDFIHTDPNESFPPKGNRSPVIIDSVWGIKKPVKIGISHLQTPSKAPVSPHDYDLLFHLLLLRKLGKIDHAVILGIPLSFSIKNKPTIVKFVSKNLNTLFKLTP